MLRRNLPRNSRMWGALNNAPGKMWRMLHLAAPSLFKLSHQCLKKPNMIRQSEADTAFTYSAREPAKGH